MVAENITGMLSFTAPESNNLTARDIFQGYDENIDSAFHRADQHVSMKVIVNGRYRGGSSFASQLFSRNKEFAFFYEPLHNFVTENGKMITENLTIGNIFEGIFTCSMTERIINGVGPDEWKDLILCGLGKLRRVYDSDNPLRTKFFRGNINIYLHLMSFIHIDLTQVLKILPQIREGPVYYI